MKKHRFISALRKATESVGPVALTTFGVCAIRNDVPETLPYVLLITGFSWLLLVIFNAFVYKGGKADGTLRIDTSNPEKDVYRLELSSGVETLASKDRVTFKVDTNAHLT